MSHEAFLFCGHQFPATTSRCPASVKNLGKRRVLVFVGLHFHSVGRNSQQMVAIDSQRQYWPVKLWQLCSLGFGEDVGALDLCDSVPVYANLIGSADQRFHGTAEHFVFGVECAFCFCAVNKAICDTRRIVVVWLCKLSFPLSWSCSVGFIFSLLCRFVCKKSLNRLTIQAARNKLWKWKGASVVCGGGRRWTRWCPSWRTSRCGFHEMQYRRNGWKILQTLQCARKLNQKEEEECQGRGKRLPEQRRGLVCGIRVKNCVFCGTLKSTDLFSLTWKNRLAYVTVLDTHVARRLLRMRDRRPGQRRRRIQRHAPYLQKVPPTGHGAVRVGGRVAAATD